MERAMVRMTIDRAAAVADFDLLYLLFHDHEENLQKTRWQQPALFVLEYAMARYLTTLGISPVALAGHSLGELTALCLADVYSLEDGFGIVNQRALCMDKAAGLQDVDPGVMAAVDAPLDLLREMIQGGAGDVHVSNINSPHQVVVSGKTEAVHDFCTRLISSPNGTRRSTVRVPVCRNPIVSPRARRVSGGASSTPRTSSPSSSRKACTTPIRARPSVASSTQKG